MNYLSKVWFILSSSYKRKSIVLFFLIIISTFLEVLGIGLIVPIIIMLLEEDILTKYPLYLGNNLLKMSIISPIKMSQKKQLQNM